jgi:hypothetical protein
MGLSYWNIILELLILLSLGFQITLPHPITSLRVIYDPDERKSCRNRVIIKC